MSAVAYALAEQRGPEVGDGFERYFLAKHVEGCDAAVLLRQTVVTNHCLLVVTGIDGRINDVAAGIHIRDVRLKVLAYLQTNRFFFGK